MAANTPTEYRPLPELFRDTAERYPENVAVDFGGHQTTYRDLESLSNRVAARLTAEGFAPGDRIGLYCINSDAFIIAYLGIVKTGATVVPINLLLNPHEITFMLRDAGASGLLYFHAFSKQAEVVRDECPNLRTLIRIGPDDGLGALDWADVLATDGTTPMVSIDVEENVAAIIYTSGTTGHPKGAMLTHRNLAANTHSVHQALKMKPGRDVFLVVLPLFHSFAATAGMLSPLFFGCTVVPVPKFEPDLILKTIDGTAATVFLGVPSMYSTLLRLTPEQVERTRSLRLCVSGGAAMPVEVMRQFEERFGQAIYEGDGPTECSPVTCCNPIGGKRKPGSVGICVPDVEMTIRDDEGTLLPDGTVGEMCVRGPNVMKGYWNQPEETAASFFGEWFRTGDLAYRDEEGYFFIVDRKKDMVIVNGMNVYPRVIEEVLYELPGVAEAAVVGEPHPLHGEIPVAYVALAEDAALTPAAIRAFCRERLGRHEVPRKVHLRPALPKNATGKILKRELRAAGEYERGHDSRESEA